MAASARRSGLVEFVKTIAIALLIAAFIRSFLFEPFSIPSGSMMPTLLVGDYLFVSKYSYGYSRYSFPFNFPPFSGRIWEKSPERGDVVVFRLPSDTSTDYIKRVIGLPGDRVQMIKGILHINGEPVKREAAGFFETTDGFGQPRRYRQYREILPNGRTHLILELSDDGPVDNTDVYHVPDGAFFALGDNRDSSRDSRFLEDVGFVPQANIVGRAEVIFFSTEGPLYRVLTGDGTLRWSRVFDAIK
jgi:signal peptidase I